MLFQTARLTMNISEISMINQNMKIIKLNIRSSEVIETNRQDIHSIMNFSILNRNDMIRSMTTIESINLVISSRIIQIIRMTQTRLILILVLFIQKLHRIRMILTERRNHLSIQINFQTSTNIHLDLIRSEILHSRMIHKLIRFVRIERRDLLNFRRDRMNSIEETMNTKARFIMRR